MCASMPPSVRSKISWNMCHGGDWVQRILRMAEADKPYEWPNANCGADYLRKCTEFNRLLHSWNVFWWNIMSDNVMYELCRS